MNTTTDITYTRLPPGVSLAAVLELGAAMGRHVAAVWLADDVEGLAPGLRRRADGMVLEAVEETADAMLKLDGGEDDGADAMVAAALRAAMIRWAQTHDALHGPA